MGTCRECKSTISDFARKCPFCGETHPLGNDPDRLLKVILGTFGAVILLLFLPKILDWASVVSLSSLRMLGAL
jgi:hypothetical protein